MTFRSKENAVYIYIKRLGYFIFCIFHGDKDVRQYFDFCKMSNVSRLESVLCFTEYSVTNLKFSKLILRNFLSIFMLSVLCFDEDSVINLEFSKFNIFMLSVILKMLGFLPVVKHFLVYSLHGWHVSVVFTRTW